MQPEIATQEFPFPHDLAAAVEELLYLPGWRIELGDVDRGQGCSGLTLSVFPDKPDSYHPERHVNTLFTFAVPAAAYNRESWEEWLWARIEDVENHERAEWFRFGEDERRPFKPAHPDGWDPSVVRTVVSETVTNTPNAGRLVRFPCECGHDHNGRMGEHFRIETAFPCGDEDCACSLGAPPMAEGFDYDEHVRSGTDLGGDHYAKLEYLLADGSRVSYPEGDRPRETDAPVIGLMENHKAPDGSWCGGWVGFTNVAGCDEGAKHVLDSLEPLTVSPSLACRRCPSHGYIRDGGWVAA